MLPQKRELIYSYNLALLSLAEKALCIKQAFPVLLKSEHTEDAFIFPHSWNCYSNTNTRVLLAVDPVL